MRETLTCLVILATAGLMSVLFYTPTGPECFEGPRSVVALFAPGLIEKCRRGR